MVAQGYNQDEKKKGGKAHLAQYENDSNSDCVVRIVTTSSGDDDSF